MKPASPGENRCIIGFAGVMDYRSVIGQETLDGIIAGAMEHDVNLVNFCGAVKFSLSDDVDFIHHFRKSYRYMQARNISGLITWASSLEDYLDDEDIVTLHDRIGSLPTVALGVPLLKNVPGVVTHSEDGVRLLIEHLARVHGHQHIAFLGAWDRPQFRDRVAAYRKVLSELGIQPDPNLEFMSPTMGERQIREQVTNMLQSHRLGPYGTLQSIITVSDIAAEIVIDELNLHHIRVPQDVAVVGFNNQLQSINSATPITTVDLSFFEKGFRAVGLLLEQIEARKKGNSVTSIVLPTKLVVRQSCGCFEDQIFQAGNTVVLPRFGSDPRSLEEGLVDAIKAFFPSMEPNTMRELSEAFCSDLSNKSSGKVLGFLREMNTDIDARSVEQNETWQCFLSSVRSVFLGFYGDNLPLLIHGESILHQCRTMISVSNTYFHLSRTSDTHKFNALARIAIDFASAITGPAILETIKRRLHELDMPSIQLILQENLSTDLGDGRLELIHPVPGDLEFDSENQRIASGRFPSTSAFPRDRRWTYVMEVLYHRGMFMGYALIEMGPHNLGLYSTVQTLLSNSLYRAYLREGRQYSPTNTKPLLRMSELQSILQTVNPEDVRRSSGLQVILDYLAAHLEEPTDLDKMASALGLSKSHLIRKTKQFTKFTVQTLHEKLKVERAKQLIDQQAESIGNIATRLGYRNPSYFAKVFKNSTGLSPREWSRRNR